MTIPLLLAAYGVLEFRLHDAYRDYRVYMPRRCLYCAAISSGLSSRYRSPTPWYSAKTDQTSPVPQWLRTVIDRRGGSNEGQYGDKDCRHFMVGFFMPHNEKEIVLDVPTNYLLPARFHEVRGLAFSFLFLLAAVIPVQFVCCWMIWRTDNFCAGVRRILWGMLAYSLVALMTSFLLPVGTPVTQRLGEYRRITAQIRRTDGKAGDWERITYLLSDKAVHDCENCVVEYRYPGRSFLNAEEEARFLFPVDYLRRAQIRLALAVAPYNVHLTSRFFYGSPADGCSDWHTLTKRLDERLIKRDSAYPDWRMLGRPAENRVKTVIAAHMPRELIIKTVSTNACGTVNVVWYGSELPQSEFLSLYGRVSSQNCLCWVPLRTVACKERFPIGYLSMAQILMW